MLGYQIKFNRQLKTTFSVVMNKMGIFFLVWSHVSMTPFLFPEKDKIHYKWEWGQLKESARAPALIHRLETREQEDMSRASAYSLHLGETGKAGGSTGLLCLVLTITV